MPVTQDSPRGTRLPREVRRAQLLAAAREVFVVRGYHATGMEEIAERAGVTKPVLYQHFPSKLELYLALLDAGAAALVDTLLAALQATHDNKRRVHATAQAYFEFVDSPDSAYRLVFESDLLNEPAVRERVKAVDQACAAMASAVIAEDTGLCESDARLLAYGLIGLARDAALHWLRDADRADRLPLAQAADLVADLAWRGIRGFPLTHPEGHPDSPSPASTGADRPPHQGG